MRDSIDYSRVVEMIVYCPDWDKKEELLQRFIRKLIEMETLDKINKLAEKRKPKKQNEKNQT